MKTGNSDLITDKSREIISGSKLFMGLKSEVIAGIIDNAYEMEIKTGHLIIQEGDPIKGLCINLDEETSLEKTNSETGEITELHARGVGESLGEMTLIDQDTRSVSVRAKSDVRIAVINLEYTSSIFDKDPKILATFAINIARILSNRLRESDKDSASRN